MLVVTEHIQDVANMVVEPEQNHDHNLAVADLKTHSVPVLVLAETLDTDCSLIHFEVESLVARFYVAQFAWWSWVILAIMMRSVEGTELNKLLEEVLREKKCRQKHGGSDAISMTANTLSSWYLPLTNRDPKLLRMSFTPLVFAQNIVFLYIVCAVCRKFC